MYRFNKIAELVDEYTHAPLDDAVGGGKEGGVGSAGSKLHNGELKLKFIMKLKRVMGNKLVQQRERVCVCVCVCVCLRACVCVCVVCSSVRPSVRPDMHACVRCAVNFGCVVPHAVLALTNARQIHSRSTRRRKCVQ